MELLLVTSTLPVMFSQLILAVFLGMLLGIERSLARKTAGMRTYALVALAACLFIIISNTVTVGYINFTDFDPMRVAAGIITGIGFLGAGLIIFRESKLQGLTTAASLWVAAGIGMAVGYGLYALAVFTTLLTLFVFTMLWYIEKKIKSFSSFNRNGLVEGDDELDDNEI